MCLCTNTKHTPNSKLEELILRMRCVTLVIHDDVIKWKHFPCYWPFVQGIHRSPVNSLHKGQWRGALIFFFDLHVNKRLSKQSWGWWFETPAGSLWRHCNATSHSRWCHQTATFSLLLALCAGNSPVTGELPSQRPVMRSFDVFFDLCLNKQLSKQSIHWWFEMALHSLWCHCDVEAEWPIYALIV